MEKRVNVPMSVLGEETSHEKVADYICAHLAELTALARKQNLPMLVYMLEMAMIEAMDSSDQIRKKP